jgi:cytochrome c peroxidase
MSASQVGRGAATVRAADWPVAVAGLALVLWVTALPAFAADKTSIDTPNATGVLRTVVLEPATLDRSNPFFQSLGTNGRTCASCHVPSAGWTLSPAELQKRFNDTDGLDPVFRTNDGANSPKADVSTIEKRRSAFGMLLDKGVIRVGMPIPPEAEFELVGADDPYGYAGAGELSLFRRPLPSTNLRFLTGVMWDGRESSEQTGTSPFRPEAPAGVNMQALLDNLMHQANDATVGHAEGPPLTREQQEDIALFEMALVTAQQNDQAAGALDARGAQGGPLSLAFQPFYVTINDVLGADAQGQAFDPGSMKLFDGWAGSKNPRQASIARGAALFAAQRIDIAGVGGLNDELGVRVLRGSCSTCHDSPNVGNHSVPFPVDLGLTDASRRTRDLPLYTLRHKRTGDLRQTTDPGRALVTGKWKDIGKFKGPVLRGLAARAPYFHDGSAADLGAVVDLYDARFGIGFTEQEKADLVAFLGAL